MATNTIVPGGTMTAGHLRTGMGQARSAAVYMDPDDMRPVQYTVYLHSVCKRALTQDHAIYRTIIIPACPKEKRYITFMRLNHPIMMPGVNPDDPAKSVFNIENARRVALSICDPNYNGSDFDVQRSQVHSDIRMSGSESNLTRQGVWASNHEIPTEQEIAEAEQRVVEYYRFCFNEANAIERSNPRRLQEILTIDHHMAAEMFGVDVNWHRVVSPKIECPNCGEKIKEGLAYHFTNGRTCVLDWKRSVSAGAVKREDVPEDLVWWEVKRGPGRPPANP